jgi:hypothetical protein
LAVSDRVARLVFGARREAWPAIEPRDPSLLDRARGRTIRVWDRIARVPFDSEAVARVTGRTHVVCLGDSHLRVFYYISRRHLLPSARFHVFSVAGATSIGLTKPKSRTRALSRFNSRIAQAKPWQQFLLQIGEVDCGFAIWYWADRLGLSVTEQLEVSIRNYTTFLESLTANGSPPWVLSAPLPTIRDGQDWGEVAKARREVTASQQARTDLTLEYNERLREACRTIGAEFVDVTSDQLDPQTGVVADRYLNPDPLNHHLAHEPYAEEIVRGLRPLLG